MKKIILASKSPRRKQLLELAGFDFEIITAEVEEVVNEELSIEEVPIDIAKQKIRPLLEQYGERTIITADTIVAIDGEILGKPKGMQGAFDMLRKLSGKKHEVLTGVCIHSNSRSEEFCSSTKVFFNQLSDRQIEYYIENFKPYDKAGAYAIQEWIGAVGIAKIEGCFYNVMGLPVSELVSRLPSS